MSTTNSEDGEEVRLRTGIEMPTASEIKVHLLPRILQTIPITDINQQSIHPIHHTKGRRGQKRRQIVRDDGWTHVTSGRSSNEAALSRRPPHITPELGVALAAEGMTLEKLLQRYAVVEKRWLASKACDGLVSGIHDRILHDDQPVMTCICLGTGSLSGLTQGWVDRCELSLFQIAAFRSMVDAVAKKQQAVPRAVSQEPQYNDLDAALLQSLGITKVDDPEAFSLISSSTLVYAPSVETGVLSNAVTHDPDVLVASSIEWYLNSAVEVQLAAYLQDKERVKLPELPVKDHPFHDMELCWRRTEAQ